MPQLLIPALRKTLLRLDAKAHTRSDINYALRVLRSFVSGLKLKMGDVEFGLTIEPEKGTADSGDLETDLAELFEAVGAAAKSQRQAIALLVDEMQYLSELEMNVLIMAIHRVSQRQLPIVRFDRLTPREKAYVQALAHFGAGAKRSGEIADQLGVKVQSIAPLRSALIKKGMIYSPSHGDTEFTVPLFDEFIRRTFPAVPL